MFDALVRCGSRGADRQNQAQFFRLSLTGLERSRYGQRRLAQLFDPPASDQMARRIRCATKAGTLPSGASTHDAKCGCVHVRKFALRFYFGSISPIGAWQSGAWQAWLDGSGTCLHWTGSRFWAEMTDAWDAAQLEAGVQTWRGSDRIKAWTYHQLGRAAQTGTGKSLRSMQRCVRRWTGHDIQTLKFFAH